MKKQKEGFLAQQKHKVTFALLTVANQICNEEDKRKKEANTCKNYGYKEAIKSHYKEKWLYGMEREFQNFEKRDVRVPRKLQDVPQGMKPFGTCWVYELKDNYMRFRARLVALGYNQIPGVDWKESFSPVVHDYTLKICFGIFLFNLNK